VREVFRANVRIRHQCLVGDDLRITVLQKRTVYGVDQLPEFNISAQQVRSDDLRQMK